MSSYKNIALLGGSGSIGKIILGSLLECGEFNITVVARKTSTASFPEKVSQKRVEFTEDELADALKGQDVVINAVGGMDFGNQETMINAAVKAKVKRFIPSEFSVSSQDKVILDLLPPFQEKARIIEHLKAHEAKGLTWTGIATGLLFDWGLANGFLQFDIGKHSAKMWDDGTKTFTLTNTKQLGRAVVSVLKHPKETANRYLHVTSMQTTQNGILSALESSTGTKWDVERVSTDPAVAEARQKLASGDFSGAFVLIHAATWGSAPGLRSDYIRDEELANEELGLEMESVKDTVDRVIAESK